MTEEQMRKELLLDRLSIAEMRMNYAIQKYWQIKLQLEEMEEDD